MSERFVDRLKHEIAEEKAGALGRSRPAARACARPASATTKRRGASLAQSAKRERLLWDLAERVEAFIVQREACGLRDFRHVLKHYDIPREVIARVGARRAEQLTLALTPPRRRALVGAVAAQDVEHREIALVARVLEHAVAVVAL